MSLKSEQMWGLTEILKGYLPSRASGGAAVGLAVGGCQIVSAVEPCVPAVMMGQASPLHHPPSTGQVEGASPTATAPSAACLVIPCEMRAWKIVTGLLSCAAQPLSVQKLDMELGEN